MVRQNGRGLDDSVYMTLQRGAFVEPGGLSVMPVLDADVAGVTALKVRHVQIIIRTTLRFAAPEDTRIKALEATYM